MEATAAPDKGAAVVFGGQMFFNKVLYYFCVNDIFFLLKVQLIRGVLWEIISWISNSSWKSTDWKMYIRKAIAYVCYGDREIFNQRIIKVDYTNKGYRSQHYVVKFQDVFCEIQVRTLAEEVYGESLDEKFCVDQYVDWHKQIFENEALKSEERKQVEAIDARTLANTIIIRK